MDLLGIKGFQAFVADLPKSPREAIQELLHMLNVPPSQARKFLLTEAFSVAGWASYVRYRVREAEAAGRKDDDLIGLLAIRLAYDAALSRVPGVAWSLPLWPADAKRHRDLSDLPTPSADVLARYTVQVAAEQAYRRELLQKLTANSGTSQTQERKTLQMVFCIDVRSEVMRRHLESIDAAIETFGFAGFFGMPLEYVPIGFSKGTPQCPVLLQPGFQVHESPARNRRVRVARYRAQADGHSARPQNVESVSELGGLLLFFRGKRWGCRTWESFSRTRCCGPGRPARPKWMD